METITVISPISVKRGTHSATWQAPADLVERFGLEIVCELADLQNPDISFEATAYTSDNNGSTWDHVAGISYVGSVYTSRGGGVQPNPSFDIEASQVAGKLVKGEIILNLPNPQDRISLGLNIRTNIGE